MSDVPGHIQIKLQSADDFIPRIMHLCLREAECPRPMQRQEISACLGDMAHALRSALNYAMWDFAETTLNPIVDSDEYEKLRWSHDFPIERDGEAFRESRSRILRHILDGFPAAYQFLEQAQPYHDQEKHLWYIKGLTNSAAHTIPIEARSMRANDVTFAGSKPRIIGSQVVVPGLGGAPTKVYPSLPCFVEELMMFVSRRKNWVFFLVDMGDGAKPNLIPLVRRANRKVHQLVSGFYALW